MNIHQEFVLMLSVAIALVAQTGALFWWAGKINENITELKRDVLDHEKRIRNIEERCFRKNGIHLDT